MEVITDKFDGDRRFGLFGLLCRPSPRGLAWVVVAGVFGQLMCVAPVRRSENSGARPGGPRKGGKWELRIGTSRWPVHPCEAPLLGPVLPFWV